MGSGQRSSLEAALLQGVATLPTWVPEHSDPMCSISKGPSSELRVKTTVATMAKKKSFGTAWEIAALQLERLVPLRLREENHD